LPYTTLFRSERRAVDDQVLDDRERRGPPRLDVDDVAVLELAHVQLARGGGPLGAVRGAVDDQRAHAADALAAVVVERDGLLALRDELLVEDVKHLQKRGVRGDVVELVFDHPPLVLWAALAPDAQGE